MCVIVPVAPISMSPLRSATPTASPSRTGPFRAARSAGDRLPPAAPPATAVRPASRNIDEISSIACGSNPLITRGVAIGRSIDVSCAASLFEMPTPWTSCGRTENGVSCEALRRSAAAIPSAVTGSSSAAATDALRAEP